MNVQHTDIDYCLTAMRGTLQCERDVLGSDLSERELSVGVRENLSACDRDNFLDGVRDISIADKCQNLIIIIRGWVDSTFSYSAPKPVVSSHHLI